jgi:hypothetical protein
MVLHRHNSPPVKVKYGSGIAGDQKARRTARDELKSLNALYKSFTSFVTGKFVFLRM